MKLPSGRLTENGKFFTAAKHFKEGKDTPERVKVYEKIHRGIWVYNGVFNLVDAKQEGSGGRKVLRFQLELTQAKTRSAGQRRNVHDMAHNRMIPSHVKLEVWQRDGGKCVECGAADNLHFDHILPYSRGGTSLRAENIQLLCARHNIEKRDRIE